MGRRDFAARTVVITGAGAGLGRALALRFAGAGARIAALDRDAAGLAQTADALSAAGAEFFTQTCDVTREADCVEAMAATRRAFGGVDLLVNNAGITHRSAFAKTAPEVVRRVMAVNFFGALHCTHAALDDLIERRGMVIAISSVAGFAPLIARTGYAASKHALHGFFDSLRTEVEPLGVKVLLVCPSFIQTGIGKNALAGDGRPVRHAQAIVGERSTADDIASRIVEAAQRERRLLLPDAVSRTAWWVARVTPRLYARLMVRKLGQELQGEPGHS